MIIYRNIKIIEYRYYLYIIYNKLLLAITFNFFVKNK